MAVSPKSTSQSLGNLDKTEGRLLSNLPIQLQRKRLLRTWTAANSIAKPSKLNSPKPPLFLLLVHPFVDPLEDQEADATDPDPSPVLGRAHAPARPHQSISDAEAQEVTHMALVTPSAAGPTVVVDHLDATCTDQIVLVHVLVHLFAAVMQRDPHLPEGARQATLVVDMDVAGPGVTPFALAVLALDPSRVLVRVPCPTQAILDTLEAGAVRGLLVGEGEAEAAMTSEIAGRGLGRGRPLSLKVVE